MWITSDHLQAKTASKNKSDIESGEYVQLAQRSGQKQLIRELRSELRAVTVFCSSADCIDESYMDCGKEVGRLLAERGIDLVYGGGSAGLMGQVARSRGDEAGSVTGITLDFECWSTGEKNEIVAKNMFDRK